ncbi:MAG: cysteine desulfhydrase [Leptospiraceae bacterium]|nr:MAG: cysteine desulfhydrase [Leptospiraceae bacterium]
MIYLDYNSTHPPIKEILEKNLQLYFKNWSNPSGISYYSQQNFTLIENSRKKLKELLKQYYNFYESNIQIIFTSTGTEAVHQMIYSYYNPEKPYAIVSPYEHECVYGACELYNIKTLLLPSSPSGKVNPDDIQIILEKNQIKPEEISFICCIAVSNETGIIQPIQEIGLIAKKLQIPFISDTIQINGKMIFDLEYLDACTINGHKIGGGYGSSVFISKKFVKPLFKGGLQENEFRAGTENFIAIKNLVDAFDWQMKHQKEYNKLKNFQQNLEFFLKKECNAIIVGENTNRVYHTTYAIFPDLEDLDFVLMSLDQEGIICSTGSSCKSRTRQPSQNLLRMGYNKQLAQQALRFSYGIFTTNEDINNFIEKFKKIYNSILNL